MQGGDFLRPAFDLLFSLADDHVPSIHDALGTRGGEHTTIRTEGEAHHMMRVTFKQVHLLAGGDVGDASDLVRRTGGEQFAIR